MSTDLTKLMDLASQASAEADALRAEQEKEWADECRQDAPLHAQTFAHERLGQDAAAALVWTALEEMADDSLQAAALLTPSAYLLYTDHCEDGPRLELVANCPRCQHSRTQEVRSLEQLHAAFVAAGVR